MPIQVALPHFEGPLELLLHLIEENKIDIYDIPISLITKQYLQYLDLMRELDLEIASEFLIMAAQLIYIKSKMLLPKPEEAEEEEDPRQQLVEQLIDYMKFKEASKFLKERYEIWSKALPRKTNQEEEIFIQELNVFDLLISFKKILSKVEPKIHIAKETIKVEDKIKEILEFLETKKSVLFHEIFEQKKGKTLTKIEIIVTFLALLELIRLKKIKACQEKPFGNIYITMEETNAHRNNF